ncbi:hypothetical protein CYY_006383 [Polysphondylium violaceum]|uniref:PPIase cyclophilin-type domain-containing protein n=1 Tax=Polysphondylium violaceum TaxID=133409 RepID=A0A8J4PSS0_9MYCE|nr:hypothetical protein CYY_006383 [Polysphondylium violaceum]
MANVYVSEPTTKGKVILKTTLGDLEIELWPKEAPLAVRNFVQLCMEKYYDGCIFHRVIKDFIAQTGDPSGTGTSGQSIYNGEPFKDEFHSRLKFNRRGLVGMASSEPDQNQSQFFITLSKTEELTRKHTLFGRIMGDTLFNILKVNEIEIDPKTDAPLFPPKILSTEIVWNPFEDIVPREKKVEKKIAVEKKKKPTQKNLKLLSFGDDEEENGEEEFTGIKTTLPSLPSSNKSTTKSTTETKPILNKKEEQEEEKEKVETTVNKEPIKKSQQQSTTADIQESKKNLQNQLLNKAVDNDERATELQEKMKQEMKEREKKRQREQLEKGKHNENDDDETLSSSTNNNKQEKKEKRKKVKGSLQFKAKSNEPRRTKAVSETDILNKLNRFKNILETSSSSTKDNKNEEDGWKNHSLKFEKTPGQFLKD